MENDFLNVSKTKKIQKPKDNKQLKINKSNHKKKQNESNNIKYKNILSTINPKLSINNNNTTKYNINLNPKLLSSTFDFNFEINIFPPKSIEEKKLISFSQNESICLVDEMHKNLYNKIKTIIKI